MRVQSGALSVLPATVIASERMDSSDGWRLLESGELIHIDENLNVTHNGGRPPAREADRPPGAGRAGGGGPGRGPADIPAA